MSRRRPAADVPTLEERTVAQDIPAEGTPTERADNWFVRIGSDWWATILGLTITALAAAGLLPKIGW